ncbi:MAG: hypothetical protein AB1736_12180 [Chloroflexota bacterium]
MIAAAYVGLAVAALLLPAEVRLGTWLPAHLALAGAAATAIAAILPFFSAALAVAPPARPAIRIAGIGLVAGGALAAMTVVGHAAGDPALAAVAGGLFLAGIGLVATGAFLPLRGALGPRRRLVETAYGAALLNVAVGATLATLLVGGNDAVAAAWTSLKPAHAWLNLVGFVGLVVVASLLHLAPTVAGARMRPRLSGRLAVVGLAVGVPVVVAGHALALGWLARGGAVAVVAAAVGVAGHALVVWRDPERGRWTTDTRWHRFTAGSLLAGQGWLSTGLAVAAARILVAGAAPSAWSFAAIGGPLVVGGVVQVLIGALTHLVPAIGPGDTARHAAARRILGHAAGSRLLAVNVGAGLVTLGGSWSPVGFALAGAGIAGSLGLVAVAALSARAQASATVREVPVRPRWNPEP